MAKQNIKIYFDPIANSMNIWWGDKKDAYSTEEVDSPTRNDIIVKDKQGRPISIEIIGILPSELNISKKIGQTIGAEQTPYLLSSE